MELDYWLFKNKCSQMKLGKDLGVNTQTIYLILNKKRSASLLNALAIHDYTQGEVELSGLLSAEEEKSYQSMLKRETA